MKLKSLVDFSNPYWTTTCEAIGGRRLDEKLELCELVESTADHGLQSGMRFQSEAETILMAC